MSVAKRVPGTPSAVSDLRGGPGTFRGVGYQAQVGAVRLLAALHGAWRDPLGDTHLRFEMRELVDDANGGTGQLGYDLGTQSGSTVTSAEEVKSSPGPGDVDEFAARLPGLPAALGGAELRLVVPAATEPVRRLETLARHAREAVSEDQLAERVAASGDSALSGLLVVAGGAGAHAVLRRCRVSSEAPSALATQHDTLVSALAARNRREALAAEAMRVVHDASQSRESVPVGQLLDRLMGAGIVLPPPAVDVHGDHAGLLAALVALEACPVPVPPAVLADALGLPGAGDLDEALEGAVAAGKVVRTDDGGLWRPRPAVPLPAEGQEDVLHRLLSGLVAYPSSVPDRVAARQTPNVLALSRRLARTWPATVAGAFTAYDKPSKTYGDLGVVFDLATVSRDAARVAAAAGDDARDGLLNHVSRASICGVSWVLQRVGEYEEAAAILTESRKIAEATGDRRSVAFTDKCSGRIERLRAERRSRERGSDDADVAMALASSEALLVRSRTAFGALLAEGKASLKDAAESTCLLARTHAVAGRHDRARETADEARPVLSQDRPGKEWADLRLLDAELDLRAAEHAVVAGAAGGAAPLLASASAAVEEVLGEFPPAADVPWARARSEITARALLLSGRLRAAGGDGPGARERLDAADALYSELGDDRAAAEAAYESLATAPGRIPAGLLSAAEAAGADHVVLVQALRRHEERGAPGTEDPAYWRGTVDRTSTEVLAGRASWADRRRTA